MAKGRETENKITKACAESMKGIATERLLVALSGGPDSVALCVGQLKAGIPFEAAHCNFHLRGAESDRDMNFVKEFCKSKGIKLHLKEFDIKEEKEGKESVEMTCRRLRYDWFAELMDKHDIGFLALGHNADDNIETFFLNFLRGSGIRGLKGMQERSGRLLRPLIGIYRSEILEFLKEENETYITDSTNLESDFRRNFIRNEIIPLLESRWEGAKKSMTTTIKNLQSENRYIESEIDKAIGEDPDFLDFESIIKSASPETLVFRVIRQRGGSSVIAEEIVRSLRGRPTGKSWDIGSHLIVAERNGIRLVDKNKKKESLKLIEEQLADYDLETIKKEGNDCLYTPYPSKRYRIAESGKGKRTSPLGMRGTQEVNKILKDAGVPAYKREEFPIIEDRESGEVIWIPGIKRSRNHLIKGDEKEIYRINICEKEKK